MLRLLILFVFSIPFLIHAQVVPQKYETDEFEITGPALWKMMKDDNSWMPVRFLRIDPVSGKSTEAINVSYANLNENMDYFLEGLKKQVDSLVVLERGKGTIDNTPAEYAVFKYRFQNLELKSQTWLVIIPGKLGIYIGYMALEKNYPVYYKLFKETLDSVRLYKD